MVNKQLNPNPTILPNRPPVAEPSSKTILSADLGRTATKTCISRNPSGVVFIPANVRELSIDQARGGSFESKPTDPLLDMWLEYQGKGYAIGQLAADFGANLGGTDQSKVVDALIKVFACVGYFQMEGDISLVLGLPFYSQEQFEDEKEKITAQLQAPHLMFYRGERVNINIKNVWVMPEGYGSLIWSEVQSGQEFKLDLPKSSTAVVDIGHQTTDLLAVDGFRFARGASKSEGFAMNKFYENLAARVKEKEGVELNPQSLSLLEAVHKTEGERSYRPRGAKKPINLDPLIKEVRESFAIDLCDRIIEWIPERVTDVVLTGGGGAFFRADVEKLLTEAGLKTHLAQPSREANALGQYIYAETQLKNPPKAAANAK